MNISKIRKIMAEEGIIFSFSGMISQSLTSFMVETVRIQIEDRGEDAKMTRSMFLIAIEQLQNIMSYSKEKNIQDGCKYTSPGVMVIGFNKEKQKYYVNSSMKSLKKIKKKCQKE